MRVQNSLFKKQSIIASHRFCVHSISQNMWVATMKTKLFFFVYNNVILLKITFKLHLIIVFLLFISVSLDTNTNLSRVILLKVWYFLYIRNKNKTRALLSNTKNALFFILILPET